MSSYGSITAGSQTFEARDSGRYVKTGIAFGGPTNELRIRPGTISSKDKKVRFSVSRIYEVDTTTADGLVRESVVVTFNVTAPSNGAISAADIDSMVGDISAIITPTFVNEVSQGRS